MPQKLPNGWCWRFFTLTDVSFKDWEREVLQRNFLSNSFNPIIPFETRSFVQDGFKPLMGDGGQRIDLKGRLYQLTSDKSKSQLLKTWPRIWR